MENNRSEQELMQKFQMFEQQIRLIQDQLYAVEQGISDLHNVSSGLGELIGKADSEILAPIGKGIYAKSKLISEELLVDVGGRNFVKKSIPETKKILEEQIGKLDKIKRDLNFELDKVNSEITKVFMEHKEKR